MFYGCKKYLVGCPICELMCFFPPYVSLHPHIIDGTSLPLLTLSSSSSLPLSPASLIPSLQPFSEISACEIPVRKGPQKNLGMRPHIYLSIHNLLCAVSVTLLLTEKKHFNARWVCFSCTVWFFTHGHTELLSKSAAG